MPYYYKPKQITIAGITFRILYKSMADYGDFNIDKKLITIRDNLTTQETLETILHESLHACLAVSGLSYLIDSVETEEAIVRCIDHLYMPVIKKQLRSFKDCSR